MIIMNGNTINNNIEGKHENISDSRENTDMTNVNITINHVDEFNCLSNNEMIHFLDIDPNNKSENTSHHESND